MGVHISANVGVSVPLDQRVAHRERACVPEGDAAMAWMYEFRQPEGPGPELGLSCAACRAAARGLSLHLLLGGTARAPVRAASSLVTSSVVREGRPEEF